MVIKKNVFFNSIPTVGHGQRKEINKKTDTLHPVRMDRWFHSIYFILFLFYKLHYKIPCQILYNLLNLIYFYIIIIN